MSAQWNTDSSRFDSAEHSVTDSGQTLNALAASTTNSAFLDTDVDDGKCYIEFEIGLGSNEAASYGFDCDDALGPSNRLGLTSDTVGDNYCYLGNSRDYKNNSYSSMSGGSLSDGDIVMIAVDKDSGNLWYGLNGTWLDSGDPANGTNAHRSSDTDISGAGFITFGASTRNNADTVTAKRNSTECDYTAPTGFDYIDDYIADTVVESLPGVLNFSASATATAEAPTVRALPGVLNLLALSKGAIAAELVQAVPGVLNLSGVQPDLFFNLLSAPGVINLSGQVTSGGIGIVSTPGLMNLGANITVGTGIEVPPGVLNFAAESQGAVEVNAIGTTKFYRLVITGVQDGLADLVAPISSFQIRKQQGQATYLQAVIPSLNQLDDILARESGSLKIQVAFKDIGNELVQVENLAVVGFDSISYAQGVKSRSIVVDGTKTESFANKSVTIDKVSAVYGGSSVRCDIKEIDWNINPGDIVTAHGVTFQADIISYYLSLSATGIPQFYGTLSES